MNLDKTIRELCEEKRRLDQVIRSLEELLAEGETEISEGETLAKRRGRKSMSAEERRQVSVRMKKYWQARRTSS